MDALNSIGGGYTRLRELAEADREGRVTVEVPAGGGKWRCMELPPLWDTERPTPFMPSEFELKAQKSADEIEAQAREFSINIRETLETQVAVEAESEEAALREVERRWKNGEYILDADNFQGVDFWTADHPPVKHIDTREKNRLVRAVPEPDAGLFRWRGLGKRRRADVQDGSHCGCHVRPAFPTLRCTGRRSCFPYRVL